MFRGLPIGNLRMTLPTMTILASWLVTVKWVTPGPEEHGSSLRRNMGYSWMSLIGFNSCKTHHVSSACTDKPKKYLPKIAIKLANSDICLPTSPCIIVFEGHLNLVVTPIICLPRIHLQVLYARNRLLPVKSGTPIQSEWRRNIC